MKAFFARQSIFSEKQVFYRNFPRAMARQKENHRFRPHCPQSSQYSISLQYGTVSVIIQTDWIKVTFLI
jgi:hypothetical protein